MRASYAPTQARRRRIGNDPAEHTVHLRQCERTSQTSASTCVCALIQRFDPVGPLKRPEAESDAAEVAGAIVSGHPATLFSEGQKVSSRAQCRTRMRELGCFPVGLPGAAPSGVGLLPLSLAAPVPSDVPARPGVHKPATGGRLAPHTLSNSSSFRSRTYKGPHRFGSETEPSDSDAQHETCGRPAETRHRPLARETRRAATGAKNLGFTDLDCLGLQLTTGFRTP